MALRTWPGGAERAFSDIVVGAMLKAPNGWDNHISGLLRAFWGIETGTLPVWRDFRPVWRLRSRIVHDGGRCTVAEARHGIETCSELLRVLLLARIEAVASPLSPAGDQS